MFNCSEKNFSRIILCVIIFRFLLTLPIIINNPDVIYRDDSPSYIESAKAIVETGRFAQSPLNKEIPQIFRTPGYPLFLSAIYSVFGYHDIAIIVAQNVIFVATLFVCYKICLEIFSNKKIAIFSSFLLSLDIVSYYLSNVILTETLFTFLILLACFFGIKLFSSRKFLHAFLFSVFICLATHVRPISYYLIFPLTTLFLLTQFSKVRIKKSICFVLVFFLPFVLLIGGWQMRNKVVSGTSSFAEVIDLNLFLMKAGGVVSQKDQISLEEAHVKLKSMVPPSLNTAEKKEFYHEHSRKIIKQHPELLIKDTFIGMKKLVLSFGDFSMLNFLKVKMGFLGDLRRLSFQEYKEKWLLSKSLSYWMLGMGITAFSALYLLSIYAGILVNLFHLKLFLKENFLCHVFIIFVVGYLFLLSSGTQTTARFRTPLIPFYCMYAAFGFMNLLDSMRHRYKD